MLKALIFDMDGTLVDSERIHYRAWQQTLAGHRVEAPGYHQFGVYVGASDERMALDFIVEYRLDTGVDVLVACKQAAYLELVSEIELRPGVREVIERFYGRYRLAVASSSPSAEIIEILALHQLRDCFEPVVGGDMAASKKPRPDIYLKALGLLNLGPDECIACEDSESGVWAAKSAGLYTVAIPHEMSRDHDFSAADARLQSLAQLDDGLLATAGQPVER
jgi:HAD superfamily hydrolase (TIGR01509 family)